MLDQQVGKLIGLETEVMLIDEQGKSPTEPRRS